MKQTFQAEIKPVIHNLKTWTEFFSPIKLGFKRFEVRKNDRNFMIGDFVNLIEYDKEKKEETGYQCTFRIGYILHGGEFGIEKGFCVMQLDAIDERDLLFLSKTEKKY